jgi:hypothetical protein
MNSEDLFLHFIMVYESEVIRAKAQAEAGGKDARYYRGMLDAIHKMHETFLEIADKEISVVFPLEEQRQEKS